MHHIRTDQKLNAKETARITAGLVHDLNNLLMILQGQIEKLNFKSGGNKTLKEALAIMDGVVDQVREISKSLMDVCILNEKSSAIRNQTNEIDINYVVRRVVEMVRSWLHNGISIDSELETSLWPVHGDIMGIRRLLINLAENAYHAISSKGVIRVSTANTIRENGNFVCLSVLDTGIGMDDSVLSQIFEPLFTTRDNGHGMGMSVVKQVTEEHGGFIEVESNPGVGTKVRVYFPALKDRAAMSGS